MAACLKDQPLIKILIEKSSESNHCSSKTQLVMLTALNELLKKGISNTCQINVVHCS